MFWLTWALTLPRSFHRNSRDFTRGAALNADVRCTGKGDITINHFHEASCILASLRHSSVTMLQPVNGGIQSHGGGLLPISSRTEFEMCRQSSCGVGEAVLWNRLLWNPFVCRSVVNAARAPAAVPSTCQSRCLSWPAQPAVNSLKTLVNASKLFTVKATRKTRLQVRKWHQRWLERAATWVIRID